MDSNCDHLNFWPSQPYENVVHFNTEFLGFKNTVIVWLKAFNKLFKRIHVHCGQIIAQHSLTSPSIISQPNNACYEQTVKTKIVCL